MTRPHVFLAPTLRKRTGDMSNAKVASHALGGVNITNAIGMRQARGPAPSRDFVVTCGFTCETNKNKTWPTVRCELERMHLGELHGTG
ncbi:MAG: hypothetical protein IT201_00710 [Thermoleophilia bacterium]|nr:hypothetical protein [Thermoleophilia bacterium]